LNYTRRPGHRSAEDAARAIARGPRRRLWTRASRPAGAITPVLYAAAMLRPRSWIEPAGESPARVGTGAPGSRPRSRGEIRGAERGVKSLHLGGSKRAGCVLQPRQMNNRGAEPVMSRRRPRLSGPVPGSAWRVPAGYGELHARTVRFGSGEIRLPGLRRAKTVAISRW